MIEEYAARDESRRLMRAASEECKGRGLELARAERDYQQAKNKRALELKAQGFPATLIGQVLKGDESVSEAMFRRDCAQVLYDSAREALNVYKLDCRLIESQIEREWNQAKRM